MALIDAFDCTRLEGEKLAGYNHRLAKLGEYFGNNSDVRYDIRFFVYGRRESVGMYNNIRVQFGACNKQVYLYPGDTMWQPYWPAHYNSKVNFVRIERVDGPVDGPHQVTLLEVSCNQQHKVGSYQN